MSQDTVQDQIDSLDSTSLPSSVDEFYTHIKVMVESMESDVVKTTKGNKAAATRLRKSLRQLKSTSGDFVKMTLGKLDR
jgi:hypothetical protein